MRLSKSFTAVQYQVFSLFGYGPMNALQLLGVCHSLYLCTVHHIKSRTNDEVGCELVAQTQKRRGVPFRV
jgi:hypothetical protein